ncbi:hypothetical protein BJF78_08920 [Pseudonocardia sp. CNS-139]|nr:hypothetical protein BJF78_08920 [Pseudonocardia sp. CNS-139]
MLARGGRSATHEIMRYLQRVEDPRHRELALFALARAGSPSREISRWRARASAALRAPASGAQPRVECDARVGRA